LSRHNNIRLYFGSEQVFIKKVKTGMFSLQVIPIPTDLGFWWLLIVLLIIGLIAIIVIGFLFAFPIAGLAAIAVFFLTGSLLWAGITFLVVALISAAIGNALDIGHRHDEHEHEHD